MHYIVCSQCVQCSPRRMTDAINLIGGRLRRFPAVAAAMPEAKFPKSNLDRSAALKVRMEGYYQSLVQQAKEREAR